MENNLIPGRRLVLTSVNQLITLVKAYPQLAAIQPRFQKLSAAELSVAPKKSCNCGAKQNFTTPDVNKQVAENILSSLTTEDFQAIKSALNLSQLCYYKRNTEQNKIELVCI